MLSMKTKCHLSIKVSFLHLFSCVKKTLIKFSILRHFLLPFLGQAKAGCCGGFFDMILKESNTKYFSSGLFHLQDDTEK